MSGETGKLLDAICSIADGFRIRFEFHNVHGLCVSGEDLYGEGIEVSEEIKRDRISDASVIEAIGKVQSEVFRLFTERCEEKRNSPPKQAEG